MIDELFQLSGNTFAITLLVGIFGETVTEAHGNYEMNKQVIADRQGWKQTRAIEIALYPKILEKLNENTGL